MFTPIFQNKKLRKNLLTFLLFILPACFFTIKGGETRENLAQSFIKKLSQPGSSTQNIKEDLKKNNEYYYDQLDTNNKSIIMYWIESSEKDLSKKLLEQLHSLKRIRDIRKTFEYAVKSSREDIIEWLICEVEELGKCAINLNESIYLKFFIGAVKKNGKNIVKSFLDYAPGNDFDCFSEKALSINKDIVLAAIQSGDQQLFQQIIEHKKIGQKDPSLNLSIGDLGIELIRELVFKKHDKLLEALLKRGDINFNHLKFYTLLSDMIKEDKYHEPFKSLIKSSTKKGQFGKFIDLQSKHMLDLLSDMITHKKKDLFKFLLNFSTFHDNEINLNADQNYLLLQKVTDVEDLGYLEQLLKFGDSNNKSSINLAADAVYGILESIINNDKKNVLKKIFDHSQQKRPEDYFIKLGNNKGAKLVLLSIDKENKVALQALLGYKVYRAGTDYQVSLDNENGYQAFIAALKKSDDYWLNALLQAENISTYKRVNLAGENGFKVLELAWKNKERVSKILLYSSRSSKDMAINLNHVEIVSALVMPLVEKEDKNNGDLLTKLLSYKSKDPSKGINVANKDKLAIQAIKSGNFTATQTLIKSAIISDMNVSRKVQQGNTFFHLAIQTLNRLDEDKDKGQIKSVAKIIQFLIGREININITNDNGKKGLDLLTDPNKEKYLPEALQRNKKSKVDKENKNDNDQGKGSQQLNNGQGQGGENNNNNDEAGEELNNNNKDDDEKNDSDKDQKTTKLEIKKDQNKKQLLKNNTTLYQELLNGEKKMDEIESILDQYILPEELQTAVVFQAASKGQKHIWGVEVNNKKNQTIYNIMQKLLKDSPNLVNKKDNGMSLIEKCAQCNNSRCIALLVKIEEINEEDVNKALIEAASHHYAASIKELLEYGKINPNYLGEGKLALSVKKTPLMMLLSEDVVVNYAKEGQKKSLELLLDSTNIDVNIENENKDTALYFATKYATAAAIQILINAEKVNIEKLYDNETILHIMVRRIVKLIQKKKKQEVQDMKEVLKKVLNKNKIDPSLKDGLKSKAADLVENEEIKQMLEEAEKKYKREKSWQDGDNDTEEDSKGKDGSKNEKKTLSWKDQDDYDGVTGGSERVQYHENQMIGVLNKYNLDENIQVKALIHAAQKGKERFMKKLIEKYPNILRLARSKGEKNVIQQCVIYDSAGCIKLLLREDASITQEEVQKAFKLAVDNEKSSPTIKAFFDYDKFDINYVYEGGQHILLQPCHFANVRIIKVLFEHPKIDINFTVEYENSNHQNVRSKPPLIDLVTNYASKQEDIAAVLELFLARPELDITVTKDGNSVTELAVVYPFVLEKLINSPRVGISNDRRFTKGRSLLHLMVERIAIWDKGNYMPDRNKKLKELLKEVLDKKQIDPSLEDNQGKKAIDYATSDQVKELLTKAEQEYRKLGKGPNNHRSNDNNNDGNNGNDRNKKIGMIIFVIVVVVASCLGVAYFLFPGLQDKITKKGADVEQES